MKILRRLFIGGPLDGQELLLSHVTRTYVHEVDGMKWTYALNQNGDFFYKDFPYEKAPN